ncbi:MAG TPA: glutathione transferase [Holosporales bacterium]|nr:glutathione transferase [Holosporales bacterium]
MIQGLNHITIAVINLEESFDFYRKILGFHPLCKWPTGAYFLVGELWFCLIEDKERQNNPSPCYTHYAFSISQEDFPILKKKLSHFKVPCWKDNKSEGDSLYFLDPNAHKLECHVGNWRSRMSFFRETPKDGMIFLIRTIIDWAVTLTLLQKAQLVRLVGLCQPLIFGLLGFRHQLHGWHLLLPL